MTFRVGDEAGQSALIAWRVEDRGQNARPARVQTFRPHLINEAALFLLYITETHLRLDTCFISLDLMVQGRIECLLHVSSLQILKLALAVSPEQQMLSDYIYPPSLQSL